MSGRSDLAPAVDVGQLRILVALAEEGTFTDAAIRVGRSQPAVSRALSRMESELGVPLVVRTTRSLRLTPAGQATYRAAVTALLALDAVADAARGRARPLRIGYAWAAFGRHTGAILRTWREEHPEVTLEVHRVDERDAGLGRGTVDVAVRRDAVSGPGVRVEPLFDEGRLAAVPIGSPLASRDRLTLADLAPELVALTPTTGTTTLELWPASTRPTRTVEVTNTDEWLMAIASDDAVGVTPESTPSQHSHPGVRFVPMPDVAGVTVSLVWAEDRVHPALHDFVEVAHRIISSSDPP